MTWTLKVPSEWKTTEATKLLFEVCDLFMVPLQRIWLELGEATATSVRNSYNKYIKRIGILCYRETVVKTEFSHKAFDSMIFMGCRAGRF